MDVKRAAGSEVSVLDEKRNGQEAVTHMRKSNRSMQALGHTT